MAKKLKNMKAKRPIVPVHTDPRDELRRLVRQHQSLTKAAVALDHMSSDRKDTKTGETIPCLLPFDAQVELQEVAKRRREQAGRLETPMRNELKRLPVYNLFLSEVAGCGTVVAAYLVSSIDITKATKPSNLRRYCGLARIDGKLETRSAGAGPKSSGGSGTFNVEIRTRLYQMFTSMLMNAKRLGNTCKYLEIWRGYEHRGKSMPVPRKMAHQHGRWRAADIFVEDLYIVWRAIDGLPVWPAYHASVLGYGHGGKIVVNEPRILSVDEALGVVGDIGWTQELCDAAE